MKEYKIIKKGVWKKDNDFEDTMNQFAREGWRVISVVHSNGVISKAVLERDKNR